MTTFENNDGWDACQPGEVGVMVRRLKSGQRAARLQAVGTMAVLLVGIGFLGYYFTTVSPAVDKYYAGISCTEMGRLASRYCADQLDGETTQQVSSHLSQCQHCRDLYKAMQAPDKPSPKTSVDTQGRHYARNSDPPAFSVASAFPVLSVVDF